MVPNKFNYSNTQNSWERSENAHYVRTYICTYIRLAANIASPTQLTRQENTTTPLPCKHIVFEIFCKHSAKKKIIKSKQQKNKCINYK